MNKHKYKRSRQREYILRLLQSTDRHPTAGWIHNELKIEFENLSMGTVYRNINILLDQDLVQKIEAGSSHDRYDANTKVHYHFICRECETVDDLPVDVLKGLNQTIGQSTGYQIDRHRLDFFGTCPSCLDKKQKEA